MGFKCLIWVLVLEVFSLLQGVFEAGCSSNLLTNAILLFLFLLLKCNWVWLFHGVSLLYYRLAKSIGFMCLRIILLREQVLLS